MLKIKELPTIFWYFICLKLPPIWRMILTVRKSEMTPKQKVIAKHPKAYCYTDTQEIQSGEWKAGDKFYFILERWKGADPILSEMIAHPLYKRHKAQKFFRTEAEAWASAVTTLGL